MIGISLVIKSQNMFGISNQIICRHEVWDDLF